jgi:putative hydrolase of the HAD superfamily
MFKAIVFDFDGLIVVTESAWYEVFKEVMKEYEVNLQLEDFAKCIGTSSDVLYKQLNTLSIRPIDMIVMVIP